MNSKIDAENLPKHIAIIMDGNGRWAVQRNLPRFQGHAEGVRRVEEIVRHASITGIQVLTLFTFSTENWRRPEGEVSMLMKILSTVLERQIETLQELNIRFHCIGRRKGVPKEVMDKMDSTIDATKGNTGMILNLAFNYGSRTEIIDAVQQIAREVKEGSLVPENITEETISRRLYTAGLPDPDLLLRTSGEQRISNFLLWQLSYAEFYFTEKFWPDFGTDEFEKALLEYQNRDRRYGKVSKTGE